jgi:hypothetical protein
MRLFNTSVRARWKNSPKRSTKSREGQSSWYRRCNSSTTSVEMNRRMDTVFQFTDKRVQRKTIGKSFNYGFELDHSRAPILIMHHHKPSTMAQIFGQSPFCSLLNNFFCFYTAEPTVTVPSSVTVRIKYCKASRYSGIEDNSLRISDKAQII